MGTLRPSFDIARDRDSAHSRDLLTTAQGAREIMGKNLLGIEEATQHYAAPFSADQRLKLSVIPFTLATLIECSNTHMLVAGSPLTILDVQKKAPPGVFHAYEDAWYNNEDFAAKDMVEVRWHLIRKDVHPHSKRRTLDEQRLLLKENEEIPSVCELVYAIVLYFLATGEKAYSEAWGRCSNRLFSLADWNIGIGAFGWDGLGIGPWRDCQSIDLLGLATARKPDRY